MAETIIKVENLAKRYVISHQVGKGDGLRHRIEDVARAPFRWLKNGGNGQGQAQPAHEEFWALKDVSFEIKRGDVVGIIGRNGAGKSTLLKILSRIVEPTSGRVVIDGRVASLLEVGTGFHPELTGRENIYLNGAILGMSKVEIKKKFDEIVAFAETEKFLDTPVKRYSSGMYVRLAFAVAAHLEPEILIVDEVLAVGDGQFQKKCLGKMEEVSKGGRTVLFVSHNLLAVQRLCSLGLVLHAGKVIAGGKLENCIESYLATGPQMAGFLADLSHLPQNHADGFRYCSIALLDANGGSIDHLTVGQDIHVEIQFELERPHRDLIIGFAVRTADELPLFATHNNDYGETYTLDAGNYKVRMKISPNFLRRGRYSFSLGAISSGSLVCHINNALLLEIEPVASQKSANYDDRIGALFIPMTWSRPIRI